MNKKHYRIAAFVAVALAGLSFLFSPSGKAKTGDLDPGFGNNGMVTTSFGSRANLHSVVLQPDGKLVAVGEAFTATSNTDFAIARYELDGSLDSGFGKGGKISTDFAGNVDIASAVQIQADGKILVAGGAFISSATGNDFALARYDRQGNLDPTFGNGGKVSTDFFQNSDNIRALLIQPDNKILAVGYAFKRPSFDFAIARYNSDGSLDQSFGTGGTVVVDLTLNDDQAWAAKLQADGKIVVAGYATSTLYDQDFALLRFNPDGSFDTQFGNNGKVITSFALGNDQARALTIQPDGKIVVAGFTIGGMGFDFALARYESNGTLDLSFGNNGLVKTDFFGRADYATAISLSPKGQIIVVGQAIKPSNFGGYFVMARYRNDGRLDTETSTEAKTVVSFFPDRFASLDEAAAIVIQADGKVVAAGTADSPSGPVFAIARYQDELIFDRCLKDAGSENYLKLNSVTGVFLVNYFSNGTAYRFEGTSLVTPATCKLNFSGRGEAGKINGELDNCVKTGRVTIKQTLSEPRKFKIKDDHIENNGCRP
ncbi:MAG: hypothetical protein HY231_03530 [Acidobacteria bacterium]|nr:hypothetical protein [Acidobacteriota bacterium]